MNTRRALEWGAAILFLAAVAVGIAAATADSGYPHYTHWRILETLCFGLLAGATVLAGAARLGRGARRLRRLDCAGDRVLPLRRLERPRAAGLVATRSPRGSDLANRASRPTAPACGPGGVGLRHRRAALRAGYPKQLVLVIRMGLVHLGRDLRGRRLRARAAAPSRLARTGRNVRRRRHTLVVARARCPGPRLPRGNRPGR